MHSGAYIASHSSKRELVEQARLLLDQHAEAVALRRIVDRALVALPVGEALHQLAVERSVT